MKETILKINKTVSCFFEKDKQNWQTFSWIHQEKKREKSIHQEKKREKSNQQNHIWKKKRLQQTMQKYKGL